MAYFFVSYLHSDREKAKALRDVLRAADHQVFLDKDALRIGEPWRPRLLAELGECDAVLPLVTPGYTESSWCVAEVAAAKVLGKRVFPLAVGGRPADVPFLAEEHYVEWRPDDAEATGKLLADLQALDPQWPGGRPRGPLVNGLVGSGAADRASPFPGLAHFDSTLWWAFFGRQKETREVMERLRSTDVSTSNRPVFIIGPSGCGKSSLARAGVLPRMLVEPGWSAVPAVLAGPKMIDPIAEALAEAGRHLGLPWTGSEVRDRLARPGAESAVPDATGLSPEGLRAVAGTLLERAAPGERSRLLVVVDQVEEAFSARDDATIAALRDLIQATAETPVRLLATLRSEFLDDLLGTDGFAPIRTYHLTPIDDDKLAEVISRPAREANITLDPKLLHRLIEDTGGGAALPLLAFALNRLAEGVRGGGFLDVERYESIGQVRSVLERQAGLALAEREAVGRDRAAVLTSLMELVAISQDSQAVRLHRRWDDIRPEVRDDLAVFEERRLLTKNTRDGQTFITVTHEAFFTEWPPLRKAIKDRTSHLLGRQATGDAAVEWARTGRQPSYLWSFDRLTAALLPMAGRDPRGSAPSGGRRAAVHLLRRLAGLRPYLASLIDGAGGESLTREFLAQSYRRGLARRRRRLAFLLAVAMVLVTTTVVAVDAAGRADGQRATALRQRCVAVNERLIPTAQSLRDDRPLIALQLGVAAYRSACPSSEAANLLLGLQELYFDRALRAAGAGASAVHALALSPADDRLAVATEDDGIELVDIRSGNRRQLRHAGPGYAVAISPSGDLLAAAGRGGDVMVWDVESGRPGQRIPGSGEPLNGLAFAPDGTLLVAAGQDGTIRRWDTRTLRVAAPPLRRNGQPLGAVAFSPDGRTLATAGADTEVVLWDVASGTARGALRGHTGPVRAVAFSPDGATLASAADDGTVRLWNPARGGSSSATAVLIGHHDRVRAVAFAPDGATLASGGDDASVRLWDPGSGAQLRSLAGPSGPVSAVAFSRDGLTLAGSGLDGSVGLWDVAPGGAEGPPGVSAVAFGPAGSDLLATAAPHRPIMLRDRAGHRAPLALGDTLDKVVSEPAAPVGRPGPPGDPVVTFTLAFSPDGALLAGPMSGGRIGVWRTSDGELETTFQGHDGPVFSVAFSPDGDLLASGGQDATVRLWSMVRDADPPMVFTGHFGPVRSVAFSADGRHLASGSDDGSINQLDLGGRPDPAGSNGSAGPDDSAGSAGSAGSNGSAGPDGSDEPAWVAVPRYHHLPPVEAVAFSPDGRTLVSASQDRTIALWDVDRPNDPPRATIGGLSQPVISLAFDPGGTLLAGADADGTVVLWDTRTRAVRSSIPTGQDASSLAFDPAGRWIATAGDHGSPALWQLDAAAVTERICALRPELTLDLWRRYVPDQPPRRACP